MKLNLLVRLFYDVAIQYYTWQENKIIEVYADRKAISFLHVLIV